MKNAIITPTFSGHFDFIDVYLKSFDYYVKDKDYVDIYFVINKEEAERFDSIISKYRNGINIIVLFFDELLIKNGIYLSPNNLLAKYGRFSFQTLKKFYAMLEVDADRFLVLDSESSWVNVTSMEELFEDYFNNPRCYYSEIDSKRFSNFCSSIQENIDYILGSHNDLWFIEDFMWFYDKSILTDMIAECGSPIEFVDKIYTSGNIDSGVFEILLYRGYIFNNNLSYNYKMINVTEACLNNLSPYTWENYFFELSKKLNKENGLIEMAMMLLNERNVDEFISLFNKLDLSIIRCEWGDHTSQKRFMSMVKPSILAASQSHPFGMLSFESKIKNKFSTGYYKQLIKKRIKDFLIKYIPSFRLYFQLKDRVVHNEYLLHRILSQQEINKKLLENLTENKTKIK